MRRKLAKGCVDKRTNDEFVASSPIDQLDVDPSVHPDDDNETFTMNDSDDNRNDKDEDQSDMVNGGNDDISDNMASRIDKLVNGISPLKWPLCRTARSCHFPMLLLFWEMS